MIPLAAGGDLQSLTGPAGQDTYFHVLSSRYGLDGEPARSMGQVAQERGLEDAYLRQLFPEILDRCRTKTMQSDLKKELKQLAIAELGKAPGGPTREQVSEKLERLSNLHAAADVTRLDYEAKKNEILKKVQAELATQFGAGTDSIAEMGLVAKREMLSPTGLGAMGFQVEEIAHALAQFREQMVFTGKVTNDQAITLVKWGMVAGLSAQQVGELSRSMVLMGQGAQDVEHFLQLTVSAARKAGISSAALAKQFTGAGKALLELTGPKAQKALLESAAKLSQMGVGIDKLKGFIDATDVFDQTAESMARLNTVFGTQINALEVFAEQDPAKRFEMVARQLKAAGANVDMIRQEKKFLADNLHVSEDIANAWLTTAQHGGDFTKELRKQAEAEEDRKKTAEQFDNLLERGKKVLIAWDQLSANFFDTFSTMDNIVKPLKGVFDSLLEFIRSDDMKAFTDGLASAFEIIGDIVHVVWNLVKPVVKVVISVIGQALQGLGLIWKGLKWVLGKLGFDLGASAVSTEDFQKAAMRAGAGTEALAKSTMTLADPTKYAHEALGTPDLSPSARPAVSPAPSASPAAGAAANPQSPMWNPYNTAPAPTYTYPGAGPGQGSNHTTNVQVVLDGNVIQEQTIKNQMRQGSSY